MTYDKRLMKAKELMDKAAKAQEALWAAQSDLELELESVFGKRVILKVGVMGEEPSLQDLMEEYELELPEEGL